MLLPEGMSARKENQTRWKASAKQLFITIQVSYPCTHGHTGQRRALLHHVAWDRSVADVVSHDFSKRVRQSASQSASDKERMEAVLGGPVHAEASLKDFRALLKSDACVALEIHSNKLRNESSAKFLEWWQRQVKNGLVKPGTLQLDQDKVQELKSIRRGDWDPIEGLMYEDGMLDLSQAVQAEQSVGMAARSAGQADAAESPATGLISASFLNSLQQSKASRVPQQTSGQSQASGSDTKHETQPLVRRTLVVLQGHESWEDLYRKMPTDSAMIEFPHIEVWSRAELLDRIHKGIITREYLQNDLQESSTITSEGVVHPPSPPPDDTKKSASDVHAPPQKKLRTDPAESSALMGLSAYASSEEEEDEEGGALASHASPLIPGGSLADIARAAGMTPTNAS